MHGKLKDGKLIYAPLNYFDNGKVIFNFNKNTEIMITNGFKKVIDVLPEYNPDTQIIITSSYVETEYNITINYTVEEKSPEPPTLEEQVEDLKNKNNNLSEQLSSMQEILDFLLLNNSNI